jgi:hypothetical protein
VGHPWHAPSLYLYIRYIPCMSRRTYVHCSWLPAGFLIDRVNCHAFFLSEFLTKKRLSKEKEWFAKNTYTLDMVAKWHVSPSIEVAHCWRGRLHHLSRSRQEKECVHAGGSVWHQLTYSRLCFTCQPDKPRAYGVFFFSEISLDLDWVAAHIFPYGGIDLQSSCHVRG